MVDPLAITSAAPPAAGPQTARVTALTGDDGASNFAQALHAANNGCSSSTASAQTTTTVKAPSTPASATPATQAAVGQASAAEQDAPTSSTPNSVKAIPTGDEVVPVVKNAAPAPLASADADSVDAAAPSAGRTDGQSQVGDLHANAPAESKVTVLAAIDHPAKGESAKHHGKKHSAPAAGDASPAPIAQTSLAANSVDAAVSPSAAPTATPSNGRSASPQGTISVSICGPLTPAAQTASSATAAVLSATSALADRAPQVQQGTDVVPAVNTAAAPQQDVQPDSPVTAGTVVLQPSVKNLSGSLKSSQTTRTAKDNASFTGNAAPDDSPVSASTSLAVKTADLGAATATPTASFAAALPRHVAADIAVSPVPQPLTAHTTFHPSQDSAAIGTGLQASGAVLQSSPEMATRSPALEVGFHDANLGWLSVRASTDVSGGLHAALGARTPAALAAVDTMLPALDRFLQQENVAVHTVSAASAAAGSTIAPSLASSSSYGHAGSGHTGSSAQQQGSGRDASQRNPDRNPGTASTQTERAASRLTSVSTVLRYNQGEQSSTVSVRI